MNSLRLADATEHAPPVLLRLGDVLKRLPFGRATLFRLIAAGQFDPGFMISPKCRVWDAAQVDRFVLAKASTCAKPDMRRCHRGRDEFWAKQRAAKSLTPAAAALRDAVAAAVGKS